MPNLTEPVLPAGALCALRQPRLDVDDRLALRPWRETDAVAVRAAFGCEHIQRWHLHRMDTDDEARSWIVRWPVNWAAETGASWAVVDTRTDRPVGQVGLREVSLRFGAAEVSYWVMPDARGAGVAGRATRTMTRWAFGTLGLHRLVVTHSTANPASCRVAVGAGFAVEGTLRQALPHADGWHDMHLHAKVRTAGLHCPGE